VLGGYGVLVLGPARLSKVQHIKKTRRLEGAQEGPKGGARGALLASSSRLSAMTFSSDAYPACRVARVLSPAVRI
jgi:hypothetical protein